jgi:hypothetical protein
MGVAPMPKSSIGHTTPVRWRLYKETFFVVLLPKSNMKLAEFAKLRLYMLAKARWGSQLVANGLRLLSTRRKPSVCIFFTSS